MKKEIVKTFIAMDLLELLRMSLLNFNVLITCIIHKILIQSIASKLPKLV